MFGFVQWDSPIALALEVLISLAIVVGLVVVARRVNARAEADRQRYLKSSEDRATSAEARPTSDDGVKHET